MQPSAALIVAIIICIKSLFSLLAFKLNILAPIYGIGNHFYSSTVEPVSVVSTMCIMYFVCGSVCLT